MYKPRPYADCQGCKVYARKTADGDHFGGIRAHNASSKGHSSPEPGRFQDLAYAKRFQESRCSTSSASSTDRVPQPIRATPKLTRTSQVQTSPPKKLAQVQTFFPPQKSGCSASSVCSRGVPQTNNQPARPQLTPQLTRTAQVQTSPTSSVAESSGRSSPTGSRARPPGPSLSQMMRYALMQLERLPNAPQYIEHVMVRVPLYGNGVPPPEAGSSPFYRAISGSTSRRGSQAPNCRVVSERQNRSPARKPLPPRKLLPPPPVARGPPKSPLRLPPPPVAKWTPKSPPVASYPASRNCYQPPCPPSLPPPQPQRGPSTGQCSSAPSSDNYDSDLTTRTNSDVGTSASARVCSACGDPEHRRGVAEYNKCNNNPLYDSESESKLVVYQRNNNPLYDTAASPCGSARSGNGVATRGGSGGGDGGRFDKKKVGYWAVLLVAGGLVTFGLLWMTESLLGVASTKTCGCLGLLRKARPHLMADGFKHREVVHWVSCPADDSNFFLYK